MNLRTEIFRKIMHLLSSIIGFSVLLLDKSLYIPLLLTLTLFIVSFDFLRIKFEFMRKIYNLLFHIFTRVDEKKQITGASFLFIGSSIVVCFFEQQIAVAGLLILSFSDSFAALVGIIFGKTKLFNKTLEGSITFFITSLIILNLLGFDLLQNFTVSCIATIVELFSSYKYNDNISIPISVCFSIYITNLI